MLLSPSFAPPVKRKSLDRFILNLLQILLYIIMVIELVESWISGKVLML